MLTDPFQATACFMRLSGYLIETQMRTGSALMGAAMRASNGTTSERAKSCKRPVVTNVASLPQRAARPRPPSEPPRASAKLVQMTG